MSALYRYSFRLCGLLLLWAISQSLILSPALSFVSDFFAFVGLWFLLLGLLFLKRMVIVSSFFLFIVAVSIIPLLQWLTGIIFFKGDALLAFAYLLAAALAVFCGNNLSLAHREKSLFFFALTFLGIGVVNVFFAWSQFLNLDYLGLWIRDAHTLRVYGNIGQPNLFATVLMLSFLSLLYLFEKHHCRRVLFWVMSLLIFSGIVLAQSRTTILVGLVLVLWWGSNYHRIHFRLRWFDIIVLVIIYLVLRWFAAELIALLLDDNALRPIKSLDNARLDLWRGMARAIVDGPLWGYGWTQAGVAQVLANTPFEHIDYSEHSHNLLLDLLVWNGPILGVGIIVAFCYMAYKRVVECVTIEQWMALSMVGAVLVHSMLEFPIEYAFFLLPVGFLLGLGCADSEEKGDRKSMENNVKNSLSNAMTIRVPLFISLPCMGVIAGMLVLVWQDYQIITYEYKQAKFENMRLSGVEVPEHKIPKVIFLDQWASLIGAMRIKPEDITTPEQIEWARQVSHRFAYISNLYFYLRVSLLNNNASESERMMRAIDHIYGDKGMQLVSESLKENADFLMKSKKASE